MKMYGCYLELYLSMLVAMTKDIIATKEQREQNVTVRNDPDGVLV